MDSFRKLYSPVTFANDPPLNPAKTALYPLKAILYFFRHPSLWKIIICPFIVTAVIAITAIVLIFSLALYPQYLLFTEFIEIDALCWFLAVVFCLLEILIIVFITIFIFFDGTKRRIYNKVFEIEGISIQKQDKPHAQTHKKEKAEGNFCERNCLCWIFVDCAGTFKDCCLCCCINPRYWWYKMVSWAIFIITIPINLIPGLGTIIFILINGSIMAWRLQLNYYQDKNIPPNVCSYVFRHRFPEFASFGTVCLILDLIPLLDILLVYTNIVASGIFLFC